MQATDYYTVIQCGNKLQVYKTHELSYTNWYKTLDIQTDAQFTLAADDQFTYLFVLKDNTVTVNTLVNAYKWLQVDIEYYED